VILVGKAFCIFSDLLSDGPTPVIYLSATFLSVRMNNKGGSDKKEEERATRAMV